MKKTLSRLCLIVSFCVGVAHAQSLSSVIFSDERGFYNAPFQLKLVEDDSSATVQYTLDGSEPNPQNGTTYTSPIPISNSTVVRAMAYSSTDTTDTATHTYIFLGNVFTQQGQPVNYPTMWGQYQADYEVNADIADHPQYSSMIKESFAEFPVISLVLDKEFLFNDSTGIYTNSEERGVAWERATSVEMIYSDGTEGFQENAGLRIMGGVTRNPEHYKKHSLRLLFKSQYGAKKLKYPIFGDEGADEHNTLVFRMVGQFNVNDHRPYQCEQTQIAKDQFARELQAKMGQPTARGRFVHVFLNGLYWGMYNLTERPDAAYMEEYFGGDKEDYDALNSLEPVDGDSLAWYNMVAIADNGLAEDTAYQNIQEYIDVDNFFDYMILNHWGINTDWDYHNWYATRKREPGAPFRFFSWDAEFILAYFGSNYEEAVYDQSSYPHPRHIFHQLIVNENAKMRFADRVQCNCYGDGALTPQNTVKHYEELADKVKNISVAETARWGDATGIQYNYNDHIKPTTDNLVNNRLPVRTDELLTLYRTRGAIPYLEGVEYSIEGGLVLPSQVIQLQNPNPTGDIYYTTDGTDPRTETGGLSTTAILYTNPLIIINAVMDVKARVMRNNAADLSPQNLEWSAMCPKRFYQHQNLKGLVINEIHYHPDSLCSNGQGSELDYIELTNVGNNLIDLTDCYFSKGLQYTFPKGTILNSGDHIVIAENIDSFSIHHGFSPDGEYLEALGNGGDILVIKDPFHNIIDSVAYDDANPWDVQPDGGGASLELLNPTLDNANPLNWFRADSLCDGTPRADNSRYCQGSNERVIINEINYNSDNSTDPGDWVELFNPMPYILDLSNWQFFDENNEHTFPQGTALPSGGFLVLVEDSTMFSGIFPNVDNYMGSFNFNLSGGGERITILTNDGCLADYVIYDDDMPWDTIPDGNGPTLSLINSTGFDNAQANSWIPSTYLNAPLGTPGRVNRACPQTNVTIPTEICAEEIITFTPDIVYNNMKYEWFFIGGSPTSAVGSTGSATWNTIDNHSVQLITKYYECTSVKLFQIEVTDCTPVCADIKIKVAMEGVYDTSTGLMHTTLNSTRKLLPGQTPSSNLVVPTPAGQPYNVTPWNYNGTEGVNFTNNDYSQDIVDWLLVSFRTDAPASFTVAKTAALLYNDGHVEFPDQCALPLSPINDSLYITIEHRNHIGVMSPDLLPILNGTISHDFTLTDSYKDPTSYGEKQLANGIWAMYCCDGDQSDFPSFDINGIDKTMWYDNNGFFDLYMPADYNMDGDINGGDKAKWNVNNGISSRVPK